MIHLALNPSQKKAIIKSNFFRARIKDHETKWLKWSQHACIPFPVHRDLRISSFHHVPMRHFGRCFSSHRRSVCKTNENKKKKSRHIFIHILKTYRLVSDIIFCVVVATFLRNVRWIDAAGRPNRHFVLHIISQCCYLYILYIIFIIRRVGPRAYLTPLRLLIEHTYKYLHVFNTHKSTYVLHPAKATTTHTYARIYHAFLCFAITV